METKVFFSSLFMRDLPFGADAESDDLLDYFFFFKVRSFLHGDFTERVDVHASVGEVDVVVFDFDLIGAGVTFCAE